MIAIVAYKTSTRARKSKENLRDILVTNVILIVTHIISCPYVPNQCAKIQSNLLFFGTCMKNNFIH